MFHVASSTRSTVMPGCKDTTHSFSSAHCRRSRAGLRFSSNGCTSTGSTWAIFSRSLRRDGRCEREDDDVVCSPASCAESERSPAAAGDAFEDVGDCLGFFVVGGHLARSHLVDVGNDWPR